MNNYPLMISPYILEEWISELDSRSFHILFCIAFRSYRFYDLISASEIQATTGLESECLLETLDYLIDSEYIDEPRDGQFCIAGIWDEVTIEDKPAERYVFKKRAEGESASSSLRLQVLYNFQGRCAACGVEEWRTQKRLHLHRPLKGKDGGKYVLNNIVPVCYMCHSSVEGETFEQLVEMFNTLQKKGFVNSEAAWQVRYDAKLPERKALLKEVASSDPGKASAAIRAFALYKFEGRCVLCGVEGWRTRRRLGLSLLTRAQDGGLYTRDNVVLLCYKCQNFEHSSWDLARFEKHFSSIKNGGFASVVDKWGASD